MIERQTIEITNAVNYFKVKDYLIELYKSPLAYGGTPITTSIIYPGGIILKSSKNRLWELEFNKEEVIIPKHINKNISIKLTKLAQAS